MDQYVAELCAVMTSDFYREGFGNTPMLKYELKNGSIVYAKLEYFNLYGSIKDRGAFFMIDHLLHTIKDLKKKTIVEGTSGNTGIATGNICRKLGLKSILFIPPGTSQGTKDELYRSGAEVIETDEPKDTTSTEKAINLALDLAIKEPEKYVSLHQHGNEYNYLSHVYTTGPEAETQIGHLPDAVVIAMGTGGSIIGNSKYFKERNSKTGIYMLQSDQSSYIQGVRNFLKAKDKAIIEKNISLVNKIVNVSEADAAKGVRKLADELEMYVGFSSGANFMGAINIGLNSDNMDVFTVFPDSGTKYNDLYLRKNIFNESEIRNLAPDVKRKRKEFI